MFGKLKKKKTIKLIFWILTIVIVPSFILWGSGSIIRSRREITYAGEVFGKKIDFKTYQENLSAVKNVLLISNQAKNYNLQNPFILNPLVWERIILLEEAKKRKIRVTDKDVITFIKNFAIFQDEKGNFNKETYKTIVENLFYLSERQFEEQIRQSLIIQKLFESVTENVEISDDEIFQNYKKQNEKIYIEYISFDPEDYRTQVEINDKDVNDYYVNHKDDFKNIEQLNIEYIGLDYPKDASPEEKKRIKEKLSNIFNKLDKDKELDLKEAAKDNNLKFRETGPFLVDEDIPGIGKSQNFLFTALFLKPGQFSKPIEVEEKGYYILRLKEKRKEVSLSFEEAAQKIKKRLIQQELERIIKDKAKEAVLQIKQKREKQPNLEFKQICKDLNLKYKMSSQFSRNTKNFPNFGVSGNLANDAFSLKEKEISNLQQINGKYYIFQRSAILPINKERFKEVKAEFSKKLLEDKKQKALQKFMEDLRQRANLIDNIPKLATKKEQD